jgi:filamentous hemagglutinin
MPRRLILLFLALNCLTGWARAHDILRSPSAGGSSSGAATGVPAAGASVQPALTTRTNDILSRNSASLAAVQAMQAAAHNAAAASMSGNLGGSFAPVPNGLTSGGLVPSSGLLVQGTPTQAGVANPVPTTGANAWVNANTPTQTTPDAAGNTTVTVVQTGQQAILNWQTFNVGESTTLDFDQSLGGANASQWVALNMVAPNVAPSQILGSIQAQGQVYVINQNGIIFGGASQVNVGALVASSLPINSNLVSRGLLNNPDLQYLFSQVDEPAGTVGPTPAFAPQGTSSVPGSAPAPGSYAAGGMVAQYNSATDTISLMPASGTDGDVVALPGAQITSAATSASVGGKVALIGPVVANDGQINVPDGQAILASGLQVGFEAHASTDPTLRGLDVYVGEVSDPTYTGGATSNSTGTLIGTSVNNGLIEAPEANVTMTGQAVAQNGFIDSSTSVSLNGRIDLLADYDSIVVTSTSGTPVLYPTQTGTVTLGAGSTTQIVPDLSDPSTVTGIELALPSMINLQGLNLSMGSNAVIYAPSASAPTGGASSLGGGTLTSGITFNAGSWYEASTAQPYVFTYQNVNAGPSPSITVAPDAVIDVAGSEDISASVAENIIAVKLLGPELADSSLQRDGILRGQTVYIDARANATTSGVGSGITYDGQPWEGTPVADVSGYIGLVERNVGELTSAGGTIALNAGGNVSIGDNALLDVSGGWINYQGATVSTTKLFSNGTLVDISQALPNVVYQGMLGGFTVSSAKYGISQNYGSLLLDSQQYDPGYLQGGNGGTLSIQAPSVSLSNSALLFGQTVAGVNQRLAPLTGNVPAGPQQYTNAPQAGTLDLTFQSDDIFVGNIRSTSPTPPDIYIQDDSAPAPANPDALVLSNDLVNDDGFANVVIKDSDGNIDVGSGAVPGSGALTVAPGGSISLDGANVTINNSITAPDGALSFTTHDYSPYTPFGNDVGDTPPPTVLDPARGNFVLASTVDLDTGGLVVDNRSADAVGSEVTAGGSVSVTGNDITLASGSMIDVSGGALLNSSGSTSYGKGGKISLRSGEDPSLSYVLGGSLTMDGTLAGYTGAGAGGSSLTLRATLVQIGGAQGDNGDTGGANTLQLDPSLFTQGGFGIYNLEGIGTIGAGNTFLPSTYIAPGTAIDVYQQSEVPVVTASSFNLAPGTLLPIGVRSSASINFSDPEATNAGGVLIGRGDFVMGSGASIQTDPLGTITVDASSISLSGSLIAPGGSISLTGLADSTIYDPSAASATVFLDSTALLSTAGTVDYSANAFDLPTGTVLDGGSITLNGNILALPGSVLDVSGTSATLDVPQNQSANSTTPTLQVSQYVPVVEDSSGGTISLIGQQALLTDATLLGAAGGPQAHGGSLNVSSGLYIPAGQTSTPAAVDLTVGQTAPISTGSAGVGLPILDSQSNPISGGYFGADQFNQSGFDSLKLGGVVQFNGDVTLNARNTLSVGSGGFVYGDGVVTLNAPYVQLGTTFAGPVAAGQQQSAFNIGGTPYFQAPASGTGTLEINASVLTDVGNLSLQGFGGAYFNTSAIVPQVATPVPAGTSIVFSNAGSFSATSGGTIISPSGVTSTFAAGISQQVGVGSIVTLAAGGTIDSTATARVSSSSGGDVRGEGTLDVAGDVYINAGQIYPPTEGTFTVSDFANGADEGSIVVTRPSAAGVSQMPLSAGGTLNLYAATIDQSGSLIAPDGQINLGVNPGSAQTTDAISGQSFTSANNIILAPGSTTSVSGAGEIIPYGFVDSSGSWFDPAGTNITVTGPPDKEINIAGANVYSDAGSTINVSGGGDLLGSLFVSGTTGTVDILGSAATSGSGLSFAIIPGYASGYAPVDPTAGYNAANYGSNLQVGEQVELAGGNGFAGGVYTLLPAQYALLPGAYLITPASGSAGAKNIQNPDGSVLASGYVTNSLAPNVAPSVAQYFKIDSAAVLANRADYQVSLASSFFPAAAAANSQPTPRLPADAGQVLILANDSLSLLGNLNAASVGGLGSQVDISSQADIYIGSAATVGSAPAGDLVLDASQLTAFGADSLLVGGYRQTASGGDDVTVTTNTLTVDNAGAPLSDPDLTLVANQSLNIEDGSIIEHASTGSGASAQTLFVNGDGVLLRLSSDPSAQVVQSNVTTANTVPTLTVGADVVLGGGAVTGSLILDSTSNMSIDPTAALSSQAVTLENNGISIELAQPSAAPSGLVLSGAALENLLGSSQSLSLVSYSSLDIYSSGAQEIGSLGTDGVPTVGSLTLNAAAIRGYNEDASAAGGDVLTINAQNVSISNAANGTAPTASPSNGTPIDLVVNSDVVNLGQNNVAIEGFDTVHLNAASEVVFSGTGGLSTTGDLNIATPLITGSNAANYSITANTTQAVNGLVISSPSGATLETAAGLGGNLTLNASAITENSSILLPSGTVDLNASTGDISVDGEIQVNGTAKAINDYVTYTNGGQITLTAGNGNVVIGADANLSVAAASTGGNAGTLNITTSLNSGANFDLGGQIAGAAGTGGQGGTFSLTTAGVTGGTYDVTPLDTMLNASGFDLARTIRIHNGDVMVGAGDDAVAQSYTLSADTGSITVNGTIDASGPTGGTISLVAGNSITLANGSLLTVHGQNFDDAGQGGSVDLEAGSETTTLGLVNFNNTPLNTPSSGPLLDMAAGSTIDLSVASSSVALPAGTTFTIPGNLTGTGETGNELITFSTAGTITPVGSSTPQAFAAGTTINVATGSVVTLSQAGNVTFLGGNTGDILPITLAALTSTTTNGPALLTAAGGETVNLENSGTSSITLGTGGSVVLPSGTPGNDLVISSTGGTITTDGSIESFNANTPVRIPAGSTVTLVQGGTLSFASTGVNGAAATGGAIPLTLSAGAVTTAGVDEISTAGVADTIQLNNPGDFTGTLHLRAPQTSGNTDLQIAAIDGNLIDASSIVAEGYQLYDLTPGTPGAATITSATQAAVAANGTTFAGNTAAITQRLLQDQGTSGTSAISAVLAVEPGAEIINTAGDLVLGTTTSGTDSDWNLAADRFGPDSVSGVLTLRASGNLVFYNSLSDGFATSAYNSLLTSQNTLLPANNQSWSYRLAAGADFSGANVNDVETISELTSGGVTSGSIEIGKNTSGIVTGGSNALTKNALTNGAGVSFYQTIRTGTGSIDLAAAENIELLNQFATVYTAGAQVTDPTLDGNFKTPKLNETQGQGTLGAVQESPFYAPQYTLGGGNVDLQAAGSIEHETISPDGTTLVEDSEKELPDNWLDRRGFVNASGQFGTSKNDTSASTSWWVDFSNFFEGIGALGGGNVTLVAGQNVSNVDAVIPTNARAPMGAPNSTTFDELGGGDLKVLAGADLDAGVYYVESGNGVLTAGGSVVTNETRSPTVTVTGSLASFDPEQTWLPTTLFLGDGGFTVTATSSIELGPVVNPFLLPEGVNNTFWDKTYFSTYGENDSVDVASVAGSVNVVEETTLPSQTTPIPILQAYLQQVLLFQASNPTPTDSTDQPWLRLDETSVDAFADEVTLMPATLQVLAPSGDINLVGNITLSPSPTGTLSLVAGGAINGLTPNGVTTITQNQISENVVTWASSSINVSDANPSAIPGVLSPLAYEALLSEQFGSSGATTLSNADTSNNLNFSALNELLQESGATQGDQTVLQAEEARHTPGLLHGNDPVPIYLYASTGDISGLTLYSGKPAYVVAGQDITDIAFYIQNDSSSDLSVVSAGRDIIPYDFNSALRVEATSAGNILDGSGVNIGSVTPSASNVGDLQIGGPGTLEVLAGRNLELGEGPDNDDGTGVGLTSVGGVRDPYLPFGGANIIASAGLSGPAAGLANASLNFTAFENMFLVPNPTDASEDYVADLAGYMGLSGTSDDQVLTVFHALPVQQQDELALDIFYLVLRDSGRDHNSGNSPFAGTYTRGDAAIAALLGGQAHGGNIDLDSQSIETMRGGDIDLFAPGGGVDLGAVIKNDGAPPGIITAFGGNVSIFVHDSVEIESQRIFTLRGGNEIIWASTGNIAAGNSSKTVQSAAPVDAAVDPQSGAVETNLASLATGGGIGVLASVQGVAPGDVDLIAPLGVIDAGDAGIRATGNLNLAAVQVLNAGNIQVGGKSSGVPTTAAPNVGAVAAASSAASSASNAASSTGASQRNGAPPPNMQDTPSLITVEVLGYGGGDSDGA